MPGSANPQGHADAERTTGGYYISAARAREPPGRWWGPGAQALGFTDGQLVERKPYNAGPGDPPARRLHRRDRLVLQVDVGATRLD